MLLAREKAKWQPRAALPEVKTQLRYTSVWVNMTAAGWRSAVPSGGRGGRKVARSNAIEN